VTTFVIGQLCAHLFYSPVMKSGAYGGALEVWQIWPPSNFYLDSWRLPIIAPAELLDLHEAVARWADTRSHER
jgi:hypothetical protein